MPETFAVRGRISNTDESPFDGAVIRALDRDLPNPERRLGSASQMVNQAITDAEGRIQITYTLNQFQTVEGI
jgi:hypothetical protein